MGCDIHMVIERRINEKWIGIDAQRHITVHKRGKDDLNFAIPVARDRKYARFARLAGVRSDGPAPRGLPDDISDLTRLEVDAWGYDGHSHSWLPIKEAARVFLETECFDGKIDPESFAAKYPVAHYFGIESEGAALDDYRLVFWFDN